MDDYKRAIYMEVLRNLQTRYCIAFVCLNLQCILFEDPDYSDSVDSILTEFFPEFAVLFDQTLWLKNGTCWDTQIKKSNGWWQNGWYEPRIRALECILRDSA